MTKAESIILTDYRGLNVAEITDLRRKLRESGVEYRVTKNTLTRFAAAKAGVEGLDPILIGPTAVAFGMEDAVMPAKILVEYAKANKTLEIKGGVLEGKAIDVGKVEYLAKIPSREELLAKALGSMQAPITGFAGVLAAIPRKLLYALNAIKDEKSH